MSKTINAGRVTFVPKDNFSNNISYKKFDIVTYNGSSYFAKKDTIGHTPTEEEFWQLVAEKGQNGAPGAVKMQVVDTLPETGETDTIYLVKKNNPGEQNLYDEYVYTDTGWEHIGDTSVDLSNYYTKTEVKQITGELTNLNTEDKSSLVSAINEVMNKSGITELTENTDLREMPSGFYRNMSSSSIQVTIGTIGSYKTQYLSSGIIYFWNNMAYEYNGTSSSYNSYLLTIGSANINRYMIITSVELNKNSDGKYYNYNANKEERINFDELLTRTNTTAYTPTSDYNPATKKYVDDNVKTYTAGDNITISEDNVISSNIGLPVLENQEINIHTFPVGSYIITGKDTVIKYGVNGASSYKPITTNSYTGNTDSWVLNISHDSGSESNRGFAFLFRKYGSTGSAALYTFDFSGMNYVDISQLMARNVNQSIYGRFDFYHALPISSLVPSTDNELTNKKYVDDQVGNINTILATLTTVSEVTK